MAKRKRPKPKPVQHVTVHTNPKDGVWVTHCLCDPGCCLFRCSGCGHQWKSRPSHNPCPKCGHDYFEWVNYVGWCRSHGRR